ncbi:MAG TPA: EAL domain-containing protein [Acidimicrobiales bacterium]|nr:EAL domain-containing protein [Acidimicrobiales bacterium]
MIADHTDIGQPDPSLAHVRKLQDQLEHQASHDALTGLPNRTTFVTRTEHALQSRGFDTLVAVLFVDLDDFKTVNDSLGHSAGDELLGWVALRLQACTGPSGTAARLGGDEFAILTEDVHSSEEAMAQAERVLAVIREPFSVRCEDVFLRCSIGVALSGSSEDSADELLANADVAMYDAKNLGDRYELFEPRMRTQVRKRHEYDAALRVALDRDQFLVNYQPMVNLDSGEVVGVEALVRWAHPEHGVLPAGDFIPLAEETGHIVPIGHWVLEEACRQVARTQSSRPHAPALALSVNLSACQLRHAGLVEETVDLLDRTGFDPHNLVLEITESVLMEDTEETTAVLTALKAVGVRLAIDDFGTGYSSLSYLRWLPVDVLKIAQPFIDALDTDEQPEVFVDAIVHMGHTLNLEVVAEGVETPEQLAVLRRVGCNMGQGYYFSRPVDAPSTVLLGGGNAGEPASPSAAPLALLAG